MIEVVMGDELAHPAMRSAPAMLILLLMKLKNLVLLERVAGIEPA